MGKRKPHSEHYGPLVASLASLLVVAVCGIVGASILLERQADQIAETEAHANSLQAKVDWFNAELRDRPMVDVPAAEAVIDEEGE